MGKRAGLLLLWMTLSCASAWANCENELTPIPWTPQKYYAQEAVIAGKLAEDGDLSGLEDGFYIYLATLDGKIVYSPKFIVEESTFVGRGLATHKSLMQGLALLLDLDVKEAAQLIAGSGEFQVKGGKTTTLTNRSGNFKGGRIHFEHSERLLKGKGLVLSPRVRRVVVSETETPDWGHTPEHLTHDEFQYELIEALHRQQEYRKIAGIIRALHKIAAEAVPHPDEPGEIDIASFRKTMMQEMKRQPNESGLFWLIWGLERSLTVDGLNYGILHFIQQFEPSAIAVTHLAANKMLSYYKDQLSAWDEATLRKILDDTAPPPAVTPPGE